MLPGTITVNPLPDAPGTITGTNAVCQAANRRSLFSSCDYRMQQAIHGLTVEPGQTINVNR